MADDAKLDAGREAECEHAISLVQDYRGPMSGCPMHGKAYAAGLAANAERVRKLEALLAKGCWVKNFGHSIWLIEPDCIDEVEDVYFELHLSRDEAKAALLSSPEPKGGN